MSDVTESQSKMNNNVETKNKPFKLLMVGNSFSDDALDWFWDVCQSAKVDVIIGEINIGGCSLQQHWENIAKNELAPFNRWDETGKNHQVIPYNDVFGYEDWDVITFQQQSGKSGLYETYQPYLTKLMSYAKLFAKNPEVKFGWHLTWAYAHGSDHEEFINYNRDQETMYQSILKSAGQAVEEMNIDILIPSGTAIQNARANDELNKVGDNLTRDGYHLDLGVGRFIATLTLFEVLLADKYGKDLEADISFYPEAQGATEKLSALAKIAAKKAVENPFKVTSI